MSTAGDQEIIDPITRTCQIIVGALVAGVVIFLAIAATVDLGIQRPMQPGAQAPPAAKMPDANAGPAANAKLDAGSLFDAFVSGPFITYAAILFAAMLLPMSFLLPGIITGQRRRAIAAGKLATAPIPGVGREAVATDTGQLAMVYLQQLIIGEAMIEGPAFFAAVAYLIEKSPMALGLAAILIMALILRFPTRRRIELWIDGQREKLIMERQAGV